MNEAKWTPGPWEVDVDFTAYTSKIYVTYDEPRSGGVSHGSPRTHQEALAMARLIAAAPDLYLALERFANAMERGRYPELQGVASEAFAALAKARGDDQTKG